jgi:hypothetical protein
MDCQVTTREPATIPAAWAWPFRASLWPVGVMVVPEDKRFISKDPVGTNWKQCWEKQFNKSKNTSCKYSRGHEIFTGTRGVHNGREAARNCRSSVGCVFLTIRVSRTQWNSLLELAWHCHQYPMAPSQVPDFSYEWDHFEFRTWYQLPAMLFVVFLVPP